jgi:ABC-2 type transport system ATP-binding protein
MALAQLGALVESPSLYDHLTGQENLEITRLMRDLPKVELGRVLKLVGLEQDAKRPVREYSLGMRQRLGLGLALMGSPSLLILDEPTNGLDPSGIQEIRELLRGLSRETGLTVFLSSHLLAEVEQVAEDIVVIHHGRLRYQGALEALGASGPAQIQVRVGDPAKALRQLQSEGFLAREEGDRLWIEAPGADAPRIVANLVRGDVALYELTPHKVNLEARFLALLEGE